MFLFFFFLTSEKKAKKKNNLPEYIEFLIIKKINI